MHCQNFIRFDWPVKVFLFPKIKSSSMTRSAVSPKGIDVTGLTVKYAVDANEDEEINDEESISRKPQDS